MFCWAVRLNGAWDRRGYAAVAVEHKLLVFGGLRGGNSALMEVHVFNTVSLRWRKLTPVTAGQGERHLQVPSTRECHTAVLIDDVIYIWGGRPSCNVLYAFDVDAHRWSKPRVSGVVPEGRYDHSACVLGKVIFIHGGCTRAGYTNDIYKLDSSTMVWSVIDTRGSPPPVSFGHSATIIGTKMFVLGGFEHGHFNNIRVFDTESNLWLTTPSSQLQPVERCSHSAFVYNGELYIFGGWTYSQRQNFNNLCKFNMNTFSWKKVEPKGKGPSKDSRMCCCMVGDRIVFFGGNNKPNELSVLDLSPSLKTLCKLAVIQYDLKLSGFPHNIRWELEAMTTNGN